MMIDKKKKILMCATLFGSNVFVINHLTKNNESKDMFDEALLKKTNELNDLYLFFSTIYKENGIQEELFRSNCVMMSRKMLSVINGFKDAINHLEAAHESFSAIAESIIEEISESKTHSNHKSNTLKKAISLFDSLIVDMKNKIN